MASAVRIAQLKLQESDDKWFLYRVYFKSIWNWFWADLKQSIEEENNWHLVSSDKGLQVIKT